MQLKIGTCGWGLKGGHEAYFSEFGVIELQDTFNNLPKPETARHWKAEAPEGFEFSMKAWQAITHPSTSPTWRQGELPEGERQTLVAAAQDDLRLKAQYCKMHPDGMGALRGGWKVNAKAEDRNLRSVYIFVKRNQRYPKLEAMDMPDIITSRVAAP